MITPLLLRVLSSIWGILGISLLVPGLYSLLYEENNEAFIYLSLSAGIVLVSLLVFRASARGPKEMNQRIALLVVTLSWVSACIIGALPYYFLGICEHFVDALFESTSGFTGTGSSILPVIESLPNSLLLWRSMTQWLAGMGIVLFFLAILPFVGVVGSGQLFRMETTGPQKDKVTPRVKDTAQSLWRFYFLISIIATITYTLLGMSLFDAVNHAMTTIATGGFSTHSGGIAYFNSAAIEWTCCLFMLFSSISYALHFRLFLSHDRSALFNTELKGYLLIVFFLGVIVSFSLWSDGLFPSLYDALRAGFFTVVCTVSTTGYTNHDYLYWSDFIQYLLVLLMVMGGMSGSTSGGIKCVRLLAAFKQLTKEFVKVVHPSAVVSVRINDISLSESMANAIWGVIFLYFLVFSIMTGILTFEGISLESAGSIAISALSNVGPAMGDFGPYQSFAEVSALSKHTMMIGMLAGRLEFYTILILFTPYFWKH